MTDERPEPLVPAEVDDGRYREFSDQCAQSLADQMAKHFLGDVIDDLPSKRGTPIERLVGVAIAFALRSWDWFGGDGIGEGIGWPAENGPLEPPTSCGVRVWFQAPVGKYRADFLICLAHYRGGYVWGAIECDGHNHHDLTKDQAQHDRRRDRHFQSQGIIILRFTGREIWRSPLKVAVEAINILMNRAADPASARWGSPA